MRIKPSTVVFLSLLTGFFGWLGWRVYEANVAAYESACAGNFSQISHAFYLYLDGQRYRNNSRRFPPGRLETGEQGPGQSWRHRLGPYLFDNYKTEMEAPGFEEALNKDCGCNSAKFVVVLGEPGVFRDVGSRRMRDLKDGPENTLLLIEAKTSDDWRFDALDQHLNSDGELDFNVTRSHRRGLLFADGRVCRMLKPLTKSQLEALLTIDGSEPVTRQTLIDAEILSEPRLSGFNR